MKIVKPMLSSIRCDGRVSQTGQEIFDLIVDLLFMFDIFINFISSYEDPQTNLPVISLKKIAWSYITSWFLIDVLSVLPV